MKTLITTLPVIALSSLLAATNSNAATTYSTASFGNITTITNDAFGRESTADVTVGGVVAGTATISVVYGGGSEPFNNAGISAGVSFAANGVSTNTASTDESATGLWTFSIAPGANFQVDGISLFTSGTAIANPVYANITTDGLATVQDAGQLSGGFEILDGFDDGDVVANGSDLVFHDGGTSTGIGNTLHSNNWSYDSAGGTSISFDYEVGSDFTAYTISNISNESIRFDAQLTELPPVPEPSAGMLAGLLAGVLFLRRRR